MKNRNGKSDKNLGVNFFGSVGFWRELPKSEEITDYEPYTYLVKPKEKENNKDEIKKDDEIIYEFKL